MSENGIKSKVSKKFKATTNSKHRLQVAENVLNRDFIVDKPNEKMVSDITVYIYPAVMGRVLPINKIQFLNFCVS